MNWNIFKKFIGIGAINIIVIILFLLLLEITFRLIFPEFKNDIHSDKITSGKFKRYSNFFGYEIRSLKQEQNINIKKNKKIVIVLGDSISDGFGHAYYDIWWNQLERLLKIKNKEYKFISISGFGNNFADNIFNGMNLISKLKNNGLKPYKIIYQFNFNDIQPSKREDLNKKNYSANKFNFSKWRYEYLNQSVFARVIQHYGGIIRRNTSGSCEERDLDALGPYTWTFGSKNKSAEAQEYWRIFAKNIKQFEEFLTNNNINFEIVLSPILYEIDQSNIHPYYNFLNFNFECATIDPYKKLEDISITNKIKIYDPTNYLRLMFANRIADNNFEPFYFNADDNHITPLASRHLAEFIAKEWIE